MTSTRVTILALVSLSSVLLMAQNDSPLVGTSTRTGGHAVTGTATGTSNSVGVMGVSSTDSSICCNYGMYGLSTGKYGAGVTGKSTATESPTCGVCGQAASQYGMDVFGKNGSLTGPTRGVAGLVESDYGTGVLGQADAKTGYTHGVLGQNSSSDGLALEGLEFSNTGDTIGLRAVVYSKDGNPGIFVNRGGGNLILGQIGSQWTPTTVFRIDGAGKGYFNGGIQVNGADFAESVAVNGRPDEYSPGDLMAIDPRSPRQLMLAGEPYSSAVAGILSTKPGLLGTSHPASEPAQIANEIPLAVVGIVPCKATTANGPIHIGDLLVSSAEPGRAMKGTDRTRMLGAVVGKAMESLPEGTGLIQVLVTLQ
jgi:hypothetical protein